MTAKPRVLSAAQVAGAVRVLGEPSGTARFAAGKKLIATAERYPQRVYPQFAAVAGLLGSESKIVRWNAMRILALLARVDAQRKLDGVLERYLAFIRGGNMISAANAILGAGEMAVARPELVGRVVPAILAVESAEYETAECRNVAIGHALEALRRLWDRVGSWAEVAGFVARQCGNTRGPVARRARELAGKTRAQK